MPVDTGFLVFNESTYANLCGLFEVRRLLRCTRAPPRAAPHPPHHAACLAVVIARSPCTAQELGVDTEPSDMSFSVSLAARSFEWSSGGLSGLLGGGGNALRPAFYGMLLDVARFNAEAPAFLARVAAAPQSAEATQSMAAFLATRGYGEPFKNWYLVPQMAAVWSASSADALDFPAATFIQFCVNHSLLQVRGAASAACARLPLRRCGCGCGCARRCPPAPLPPPPLPSRHAALRSCWTGRSGAP